MLQASGLGFRVPSLTQSPLRLAIIRYRASLLHGVYGFGHRLSGYRVSIGV